jgi:TonB family protein
MKKILISLYLLFSTSAHAQPYLLDIVPGQGSTYADNSIRYLISDDQKGQENAINLKKLPVIPYGKAYSFLKKGKVKCEIVIGKPRSNTGLSEYKIDCQDGEFHERIAFIDNRGFIYKSDKSYYSGDYSEGYQDLRNKKIVAVLPENEVDLFINKPNFITPEEMERLRKLKAEREAEAKQQKMTFQEIMAEIKIQEAATQPLKYYGMRNGEWVEVNEVKYEELKSHGLQVSKTFRTKADIMKVVNQRVNSFKSIYSKYLKNKPGFSGKVTLRFTVAPSGDIISIGVVSSTTGYPEFDEAIKNEVATWKWEEAIKSGNATPTIPFNFSE